MFATNLPMVNLTLAFSVPPHALPPGPLSAAPTTPSGRLWGTLGPS